jgi:tetratricopeptide (TPR) repeat protein
MNRTQNTLLITIILLGAALRFYGLDWGTDRQTGYFHRFHNDESTIVESTRLLGIDIHQIRSSYGKAPMYFLWAGAHIVGPLLGQTPFELTDNTSAKFTHQFARSLSALMGVITIYLVFQLGTAIGGQWTGLLAAFFLAVCPGHIQQSHYYTVDPVITFWVMLALCLTLRFPSTNWRLYLAFGIVCGLAAGTRLVGVWLAVPFFIAHLFNRNKFSIPSPLPWKMIGITTAAGALTLLICEPFILLDPQHYFDASDIRYFAASMRVARGEFIRVWTLYDFNTTPFLFYITHLLRYALGTPLEIAGLIGIGLALWKRNKPALLLLGWLIPYFMLVGGLHTKPIRYATPMLPVLTTFAAWVCVHLFYLLRPRSNLMAALPALIVGLPTLVQGLAITNIYSREDSRIVANRWVEENIPTGTHVLAEHGGFATAWMAPEDRYQRQVTDSSYFIVARDWVLPSSQIKSFQKRLSSADWIILIEENRQKQFISAPDYFPIAATIYARLHHGDLGFESVAQFKNRPHFGPWIWNETDAEPTITAFDHPTVNIYRRKSDSSPDTILEQWIKNIQDNTVQIDSHIATGVRAFHEQNWERARKAFDKALEIQPTFALAHLLIGEIHIKNNDEDSAQNRWNQAIDIAGSITKYSFLGMIEAGLKNEGVIYLEDAAQRPGSDPILKELANATYNDIGHDHQQKGNHDKAAEAFARSITLFPERPAAYVNAANSLMALGDIAGAETLLTKAVQIDSNFAHTQQALGRLYQQQNDLEKAYDALEKSLALDPQNPEHQVDLFNLGSTYYQRGQTEMAYVIFEKILAHNPNFQEAQFNLGVLHLKTADYTRALPHLQKAADLAPRDAEAHFALAGAYDALGNTTDAIDHYRRVLELAPNHNSAQLRLQQLNNQ